MGHFEIKLNKRQRYYFVLKAGNERVIATSEEYLTKASCKIGINSVRKNVFATTEDHTL